MSVYYGMYNTIDNYCYKNVNVEHKISLTCIRIYTGVHHAAIITSVLHVS